MTTDVETTTLQEGWLPAGQQAWTLQTADGYVGRATWRRERAVLYVTRPDGTDLFRKTWGSQEIFFDSWPGMFDWLKGGITRQIAAERSGQRAP
jgi:hypothetical protein